MDLHLWRVVDDKLERAGHRKEHGVGGRALQQRPMQLLHMDTKSDCLTLFKKSDQIPNYLVPQMLPDLVHGDVEEGGGEVP
jgi:hypothetical protein